MKTNKLAGCLSGLEKQKPYIAMIFVQCVYGGMCIFSKAAISEGMNPCIFVAYRQGFATLVLIPLAFLLERYTAAPLSFFLIGKIFIISLIGITVSLNLYSYAMNYTSATFASATTNAIPALTFLMAVVFRMERLSIRKRHGMAKVIGCLLGICGALAFAFIKGPRINIISWSDIKSKETQISGSNTVKGSLIMILSNITWSAWLVMLGPLVKEYPAKVRLTALQCLFSFLQSSAFAFAMDREGSAWRLGWDINLFSVAYCGLAVSGMTYWLQVWAVEKKGPVFTAMFTPLALIITAFFSAVIWNEKLQLGSIFGAILLVGGLYGVLWGKNQEAKTDTAEEPQTNTSVNHTEEARAPDDKHYCSTCV